MDKQLILENSVCLGALKAIYGGSLAVRLWKGWRRFCRLTLEGSRTISFFKVGDYLDVRGIKLLGLIQSARTFDGAVKTIAPYRERYRSIKKLIRPADSRVMRTLGGIPGASGARLTRRQFMYAGLIFLALFYLARFILLTLFPAAYYHLPWCAGLLLCAAALTIFLQLEKPDRPDAADRYDGLLSRVKTAAAWLADKIRFF